MAQPDRPVVCVIGEGSVQYAVQAFWTAAAYDVPLTVLVLRNEEYAILKWFAGLEEVRARRASTCRSWRRAQLAAGVRRERARVPTAARRAARGAARGDRVGKPELVEVRVAPAWRSVLDALRLLEPDVTRIGRPDGEPSPDRVPDELAGGTPEPLRSELIALLGEDRVLTRVDRPGPLRVGRQPVPADPEGRGDRARRRRRGEGDGVRARAAARRWSFRSAGSSLNGQGQTDGILVDVRRHWRGVEVLDDGDRARVKPGHGAGPREPRAGRARLAAGPGSREHRRRHRRRRDREQLRRHALRGRPRTRTRRCAR